MLRHDGYTVEGATLFSYTGRNLGKSQPVIAFVDYFKRFFRFSAEILSDYFRSDLRGTFGSLLHGSIFGRVFSSYIGRLFPDCLEFSTQLSSKVFVMVWISPDLVPGFGREDDCANALFTCSILW